MAGLGILLFLLGWFAAPSRGDPAAAYPAATADSVVPNDNRVPEGRLRGGGYEAVLTAVVARWRPDLDVDSLVTVQAFAGADGTPRIPGPLLRVEQGTPMRLTLRNALPDSVLVVHGLRGGTGMAVDTVHVAPGVTRELRFTAGAPGTYLYWGSTLHRRVDAGSARDALLHGALVVDPRGRAPDPAERIFVLSLIDILPDTTKPEPREDIWELAVNGRSWPHTERQPHQVGDTVRWRFLNATDRVHPMHLHGFHFRVLAKGDGSADTAFVAGPPRLAVTELMAPGSTFRMEWVPTRAGNWLMHCHMVPHITPFPERTDTLRNHDLHDVGSHPVKAMAGLVLGITVTDPRRAALPLPGVPQRRLRVLAQERVAADTGAPRRGYLVPHDVEPSRDSVPVSSSPLVLVRGQSTAITVVNRLREPTTVHWHGIELESVYDGVSGWSGGGGSLAPLLAPGDSFTVLIQAPRAGTYIYHTHMDEGAQLTTGLYGPLLVLEPGEHYHPETDLVLMLGEAVENGVARPSLNGRHSPAPLEVKAGQEYRLRFINIMPAVPLRIALLRDSVPVEWTALAKDGAVLPAADQRRGPARVRVGVGETYDFRWTPANDAAELLLMVSGGPREPVDLRLPIRVRAGSGDAGR
jgi:FtsP/CotA-like multicopper oxidase with cupredoxin domain